MAKILNILSSKKLGGLEEAYICYTKALVSGGHKVTMLAHPKAKMLNRLKEIKGAQLVTSRFFSRKSPVSYFAARYILRKIKPDLVLLHNSRVLKLFKNAVVVNHGYNPKRILKAKNIICVNSQIKAETEKLGNKNAYVLHNALPEILPLRPKLRSETPVIGFMGRLSHQKGADVFLQALAALKDVSYKAIIAGSGEDEGKLKILATDLGLNKKVEFIGWIEVKKSFYDSIDIFCAPSRYEGFGLVILEAMSYGVPVITTLSDGPRDIIDNHVDGILVEPESAKALAEQIKNLITNPKLCEDMRQQAHKTLQEKFGFDSFVKNLNEIIKKCASYS